jgi:hypothetical protein
MPIHDRYARVTPYELFLPAGTFADERFPTVRKEAETRGSGLDHPDGFALLAEAGAVLREIRGEEEDPGLIRQYGALLFHTFHFWQDGCPLYLLETAVLRFLVRNGPQAGEWSPALPGRAGYLQLPQHLVWAAGGEGSPRESLDGLFWAAPDGETLSLLVAMGMRRDRPGLSVVPLPTLPLVAAAEWASIPVREGEEDFSSTLPGAELEGLYALKAGAEALKLAMRVFWYLDSFPASVSGVVRGPESAEGPAASLLAFRRIVAGEG